MKPLKRYQILFILITSILFFFIFQILFLSNLNQSNIETRFDSKLVDFENHQSSKIKKHNYSLATNRTKYFIPLDSKLNPQLIDILPFNQRIGYLNKFKKVFLTEKIDNLYDEKKIFSIEYQKHMKNSVKHLANEKIPGILIKDKFLYEPNAENKFKCINSNQNIPFKQLNDNYCDCLDGTDEPGTNACNFGYFYCDIQNEFLISYRISSSKVNDKICDCCDGSDEKKENGCKNVCSELILSKIKEKEIKMKGISQKKKYLAEGILKNEKLYGPRGVFYRISRFCFEFSQSKYTYKVCPYKEVLQIDSNKQIKIGRDPKLIQEKSGEWMLKMINGDSNNCPQARMSEIKFKCGTNDEIISLQETQKCVYVFILLTPSIC